MPNTTRIPRAHRRPDASGYYLINQYGGDDLTLVEVTKHEGRWIYDDGDAIYKAPVEETDPSIWSIQIQLER